MIEQVLRFNPAVLCQPLFLVGKLALEPADHPKAAVDLNFKAIRTGNRGGIRRDEGDDLQVFPLGGVDGCRGAVAEAGNLRVHAAGPDHFAGFVGCRRNQRQSFRDAGIISCLAGDLPQHAGRRHQFRQDGWIHRNRLPLPIGGAAPAQALVIKRDVRHLAANRVHVPARQPVGEVAREKQVLAGCLPDVRLEGAQPVCFRLRLQISHRLRHTGQPEAQPPQSADWLQARRAALVEPDDCRAERVAISIQVDHR